MHFSLSLLAATNRADSPWSVRLFTIPGWAEGGNTEQLWTVTSSFPGVFRVILRVSTWQQHFQAGVLAKPCCLVDGEPAGFTWQHQVCTWTHHQCFDSRHISRADGFEQRLLLPAGKTQIRHLCQRSLALHEDRNSLFWFWCDEDQRPIRFAISHHPLPRSRHEATDCPFKCLPAKPTNQRTDWNNREVSHNLN